MLVRKLVVPNRISWPLRDSDSISGRRKDLGDLVTRRGNSSPLLSVPTYRGLRRSWQLLLVSAPPLFLAGVQVCPHAPTCA